MIPSMKSLKNLKCEFCTFSESLFAHLWGGGEGGEIGQVYLRPNFYLMHSHMHTHTCTHMHTHTHTRTYVHTQTHVRTHTHTLTNCPLLILALLQSSAWVTNSE